MKHLTRCIALPLFLASPCQLQAGECVPLAPVRGVLTNSRMIYEPGEYCLESDIVQEKIFDWHAGTYKSLSGKAVIAISYSDARRLDPSILPAGKFLIDLKTHSVVSRAENMFGFRTHVAADVEIRNGRIEVPGNDDNNVGVSVVFGPDLPRFRLSSGRITGPGGLADEDIPLSETLEPSPLKYRHNGSVVEEMAIRTGWRGVQMGGGDNILRNSIIEVDGHTAVYLYGPGSIIENNTIIVHGKGNSTPFDAPIKLRDANGAIVRNNRIVYKGIWPFGKAPAAINLLDSKDVRIEGNTLERIESLVRVNGDTQYTENNNIRK